ncbi:MAG TPA: SdrD B-like domain-containing protein, partial [Saprospiraceae bacterium]|nr:SdrD B-like domain-containing protein [Saprospiraceae bacterium]
MAEIWGTQQGVAAVTKEALVRLQLPDNTLSQARGNVDGVNTPVRRTQFLGVDVNDDNLRDHFVRMYGAEYDTWGLALTPAIVNDPSFKLTFRYVNSTGNVGLCGARLHIFYSLPSDPATSVAGIVFEDHNSDGALNAYAETGIGGVTVTAYDAAGGVVGSAVTDVHGFYDIAGATAGQALRLEFGGLFSGDQYGFIGSQSNSNVLFVTAPNLAANLGTFTPSHYDLPTNNMPIFATCFVPGPYDGILTNGTSVVSLKH